jgi:hypothetical protein
MKQRNLLTIAVCAVLLTACIPSVHPFYTDKDLVFDARLLGEWQKKGATGPLGVWKFEQAADKVYKLTVTEKEGKQGQFVACLLKLDDHYFLDIIPTDCGHVDTQAELLTASVFPGHLLLRVPQLAPELKLAFFDFGWLTKCLEANPDALAHHNEGKRTILTASTADLQRFVLGHIGEGQLFSSPEEMARKAGDAPTAILK